MSESIEQQKKPDAKVMKVRFKMSDGDLEGALFVAINMMGEIAGVSFVLITEKEGFNTVEPSDDWQKFLGFCNGISAKQSPEQSGDIEVQIRESIEGYQVNQDILAGDKEIIEASLREIFAKALKADCSECVIELEDVTDFSESVPPEANQNAEVPEIEKSANLVLDATLVISPVRGKYIQDIVPGDLMKVVLLKKDEVTKKVAKALKALNDEGDYIPVKGRVKQKFPNEKGGSTIYCVIAKNILAKIVEEENIKAELYLQEIVEETKTPIPRVFIYAGVTAVSLIILSLIILFLL